MRPILGLQLGGLDPEEFGDPPLNQLDGHDRLFVAPEVREHLLSEVHGQLAPRHRTDRDHPRQRALELADVRFDATGDQVGDLVGQTGVLEARLLLEDGDPGLEVRRLDVGDESPLEA